MIDHEQALGGADWLERIERLEQEIARYREHAQQTSKLLLYATNYAASIRQSARRDAELTLRKARERAAKIHDDLETERRQVEHELLRLQALTDETRSRLSAFTKATLHVLNAEVEDRREDVSQRTLGDLQKALQTKLSPASGPAPPLPSVGRPEE